MKYRFLGEGNYTRFILSLGSEIKEKLEKELVLKISPAPIWRGKVSRKFQVGVDRTVSCCFCPLSRSTWHLIPKTPLCNFKGQKFPFQTLGIGRANASLENLLIETSCSFPIKAELLQSTRSLSGDLGFQWNFSHPSRYHLGQTRSCFGKN